jgi:hypothetical protein
MTILRFISDEELRNAVERDKKELDSCVENKLSKSTLVLAGSIIEAILVDCFLAFPHPDVTPEQLLTTNLAQLIDWAEQDGWLTQRTRELSTIIKNYRNIIHPGREYRLKEKVDSNSALVAAKLVDIIIQEISENYAKKLGYTAEQAIHKVGIDPTCMSIFPHMIDKMVKVERIKLFKAIPSICNEQTFGDGYTYTATQIESFIKLHDLLKGEIPENVLKVEVHGVYDYIHNESKEDALFHLRFYKSNLEVLEPDQLDSVLSYLLSILVTGDSELLQLIYDWGICSELGKFLNNDRGKERIKNVIKQRLGRDDVDGDDEFLHIMGEHILDTIKYDLAKTVVKDIQKMNWYQSANRWAEILDESIVPF